MRTVLLMTLLLALPTAHGGPLDPLFDDYRRLGAGPFDAGAGQRFWSTPHAASDGSARQCADCHGDDTRRAGRHVRTGKPITPLAPSVQNARMSDPATVEKWLLRNCKWTVGRACTAQEKGDLVTWLGTL